MKRILAFLAYFVALSLAETQIELFKDDDNVIQVDMYNYLDVLDYVKEKEGILMLHTYKDKCASCVGINKNLKGIAKHIAKNETIKDKYFIGLCNLSENSPLEKNYFIGPLPKVWYFAHFENMRRQKFDRVTSLGVVMKWFRSLKPTEPDQLSTVKDYEFWMRNSIHHMIFGFFDNSNDSVYKTEFTEMANFFSHIPTYACFLPCELTNYFNMTDVTSPTIAIIRKPEIVPEGTSLYTIWNQSLTPNLISFVEQNYLLPVDIYSPDGSHLYNPHLYDMALFYYGGSTAMYHERWDSPISQSIMILNKVYDKLASTNFTSEDQKDRFSRLKFGLCFKMDYWYWSQILHLKVEMDYAKEFTPLVRSSNGRFYMQDELKYMTPTQHDFEQIYKFYYQYIIGNLTEYRLSEPTNETYHVSDDWKRRLDTSTPNPLLDNDQVEIRKIISKDFRKEIEETEQEVLLFLISENCDFCQELVNNKIINNFAKTVGYSPNFKIMIMDVYKNDLPEEYYLYRLPQVMFTGKEKEKYRPVTWKTKKYGLDELRLFLHKHSEEFKSIDKTYSEGDL